MCRQEKAHGCVLGKNCKELKIRDHSADDIGVLGKRLVSVHTYKEVAALWKMQCERNANTVTERSLPLPHGILPNPHVGLLIPDDWCGSPLAVLHDWITPRIAEILEYISIARRRVVKAMKIGRVPGSIDYDSRANGLETQ